MRDDAQHAGQGVELRGCAVHGTVDDLAALWRGDGLQRGLERSRLKCKDNEGEQQKLERRAECMHYGMILCIV
jgi:hypothetical protein